MEKKVLSLAAMEKLFKKYGARRVSEGAKRELRDIIESVTKKISEDAVKYAAHAGRVTIKSDDVKLAFDKKLG